MGGLGVIDPSKYLAYQFSSSIQVAVPLVELILQQSINDTANVSVSQLTAKKLVVNAHNHELTRFNSLLPQLCPRLQRAVTLSSWLTALPLSDHGFVLHKGAFHDALCLRYRWQLSLLNYHCCLLAVFVAKLLPWALLPPLSINVLQP